MRWVVGIGLAAVMTITGARARLLARSRVLPLVIPPARTPPPNGPGWNYASIGRSPDQRLEHAIATGPADA
jgi:hypothetical protein